MANLFKIEKVISGVKIPLSEVYREIMGEHIEDTFWYRLWLTVELARGGNIFNIPGNDVETFVTTVMRAYFEFNNIQALLEDPTKQVDLIINVYDTKCLMSKTGHIANQYELRPMSPWTLIVSGEEKKECSGK